MLPFRKKFRLSLASTALASSIALVPQFTQAALAHDDEDSKAKLQCVADEKTAGAGGTVHYHILYHNVQNNEISNVFVKIKVPEGLDVDANHDDGADWDAKSRILKWDLKNVESGEARVVQFNLKIEDNEPDHTNFEVSCSGDEDGTTITENPSVVFTTGSEIDQPFFIGYPDGNFHPADSITRAEAAAVVARILNLSNTTPLASPYSDVSSDNWANIYVTEVTNAGYMRGNGDGTFHPDAPISRAELVTLLLNIRGVHAVPLQGFRDTEGHWANRWLGTAKALGYIDGNWFDPDAPTQRQFAAKLFDIALYRGPLHDGAIPVTQHFPDMPRENVFFGWVEEGSVTAHESVHKDGYEYLLRYLPDQTKMN